MYNIFDIMSIKLNKNNLACDLMSESFEERSVWVMLFSMLLALGGYFVIAGRMLLQGVTVLPAYAAVFVVSVLLMVIVIVVGHVAIAIASRPDGRDERDRLIEWRAESRSGWLVATGIFAAICCMLLSVPNAWTANLLMLFLFLSTVLKFVLQLLDYRRGL